MAERALKTLTAGLFRAARALHGADELAARWSDERAFWSKVTTFARLPEVVDFHPFTSARAWSIELGANRSAGADARPRRAPPELLPARAAAPPRTALLEGSEPVSLRAEPAPERARSTQALASTPPSSDSATQSEPRPNARAAASRPGTPVDLGHLSELVESLALSRESGSARVPGALAGPRASRAARSEGQPAVSVREGSDVGAPRAVAEPASDPARLTEPLALLGAYTDALFAVPSTNAMPSSVGAPSDGPHEAEPTRSAPALAPRARSLLLDAAATARSPAERTSDGAVSLAPAPTDTAPSLSFAGRTGTEEDLMERLNQALLEQAFLRGVDLT